MAAAEAAQVVTLVKEECEKQKSDELAIFLTDSEPADSNEAIRKILGGNITALFETDSKFLEATLALELLDAAAKRSEPEVKTALEVFKAAQAASTHPLAQWLPSQEDGNFENGGLAHLAEGRKTGG